MTKARKGPTDMELLDYLAANPNRLHDEAPKICHHKPRHKNDHGNYEEKRKDIHPK